MAPTVATVLLTLAILAVATQQVVLYFEISALRRDLNVLLRVTGQLNHAVNPWAAEDESTEPGRPPQRERRAARWLPRFVRKNKRQPPE